MKISEKFMVQGFQNFSIAAFKPKSCVDHQNWTRTSILTRGARDNTCHRLYHQIHNHFETLHSKALMPPYSPELNLIEILWRFILK